MIILSLTNMYLKKPVEYRHANIESAIAMLEDMCPLGGETRRSFLDTNTVQIIDNGRIIFSGYAKQAIEFNKTIDG